MGATTKRIENMASGPARQKHTALHPILRVHASEFIVFRLGNYSELIILLDEVCALINKQTLLQIYNLATEEPFSFLYCNLTAKPRTIYS